MIKEIQEVARLRRESAIAGQELGVAERQFRQAHARLNNVNDSLRQAREKMYDCLDKEAGVSYDPVTQETIITDDTSEGHKKIIRNTCGNALCQNPSHMMPKSVKTMDHTSGPSEAESQNEAETPPKQDKDKWNRKYKFPLSKFKVETVPEMACVGPVIVMTEEEIQTFIKGALNAVRIAKLSSGPPTS